MARGISDTIFSRWTVQSWRRFGLEFLSDVSENWEDFSGVESWLPELPRIILGVSPAVGGGKFAKTHRSKLEQIVRPFAPRDPWNRFFSNNLVWNWNSNSTRDSDSTRDLWSLDMFTNTCLYQVENDWFGFLAEEESYEVRTFRFGSEFLSMQLTSRIQQYPVRNVAPRFLSLD